MLDKLLEETFDGPTPGEPLFSSALTISQLGFVALGLSLVGLKFQADLANGSPKC
jgi:hypothetical protein